jgi:hypothetical protein
LIRALFPTAPPQGAVPVTDKDIIIFMPPV